MGVRKKLYSQALVPQDRDLLLLSRLCTFGFLSFDQIHQFILTGHKIATYRRVKRLIDCNFIKPTLLWDDSGYVAFTPNPFAVRVFLNEDDYARANQILTLKPWRTSNLEHEHRLRDIGLSILNLIPQGKLIPSFFLNSRDWWSEAERELAAQKLPDFLLEVDGRVVGVFEVELTRKSNARYVQIFRRLRERSDDTVVYIVKDATIRNAVTKCYEDVMAHYGRNTTKVPKLLVRELDDLNTHREVEELLSYLICPTKLITKGDLPVKTRLNRKQGFQQARTFEATRRSQGDLRT